MSDTFESSLEKLVDKGNKEDTEKKKGCRLKDRRSGSQMLRRETNLELRSSIHRGPKVHRTILGKAKEGEYKCEGKEKRKEKNRQKKPKEHACKGGLGNRGQGSNEEGEEVWHGTQRGI